MHARTLQLTTLALALGAQGCWGDQSVELCEAPGIGVGRCCPIERPDGVVEQGICHDGYCESPRFRLPAPVCGPIAAPQDGAVDAVDLCAESRCGEGRRCDPANGACVPVARSGPAGPCELHDHCDRGRCFADRAGRVPGGFCAVECGDDAECLDGLCLAVEGGRACFAGCADDCRAGWRCLPAPGRLASACQIDCRVAGCPSGQRCDFEVAACRPQPPQCRYPCVDSESCREGRCLRRDGGCDTGYHCALGSSCVAGRCVPAEFTACSVERPCARAQRCVPVAPEHGVCLQACDTAADCAAGRTCRAELGACYWPLCGGASGNGTLLGACAGGPRGAQLGTCLPFSLAIDPEITPGYCVVAGLAAPGEPCDAQATERTEDAAGILCEPGTMCFGDPDDPESPAGALSGRGRCARLCQLDLECGGGQRCITGGGPVTDPLVTRDTVGLCLPVNCVFGQRDCDAGARCLVYGWTSRLGRCTPVGTAARGAPCDHAEGCRSRGVCPTPYPSRCVDVCEPMGAPCEAGQCEVVMGWALGVCR